MKARTAQIATITAAIALAVALFTYPAILSATSASPSTNIQPLTAATSPLAAAANSTSTSTATQSSQQREARAGHYVLFPNMQRGGRFHYQTPVSLSVGQTITITSTQGKYWVYATPSKNGTASGTLTFTVTAKLSQGYTLSLTSGSIVVDGTTYAVSSGSAQIGSFANSMLGQGTTTPTGQFLLRAQAYGSFGGTSGSVLLDFSNGTTEYAVALTGTIKS
jgi:outer membrane lipoprotein-sorting protein